MLANTDAIATCAVKDIAAARKFYEDTLGLAPLPTEEEGVLAYRSGKASILVYESQYAGTNKATAVTFAVKDLESEVAGAQGQGRSLRALRPAGHHAQG